MIAIGLAVIANVSPTAAKIADDVDPAKFESPLYRAVMLFGPSNRVVLMLATGGTMPDSTGTAGPRAVPLE